MPGHFEPFECRAAVTAKDDRVGEAREQVARLRVADREGSTEPARRLGYVVLGYVGARRRVRLPACVADVVLIAARKQDDIAVTLLGAVGAGLSAHGCFHLVPCHG
jgi:hypothetical protein